MASRQSRERRAGIRHDVGWSLGFCAGNRLEGAELGIDCADLGFKGERLQWLEVVLGSFFLVEMALCSAVSWIIGRSTVCPYLEEAVPRAHWRQLSAGSLISCGLERSGKPNFFVPLWHVSLDLEPSAPGIFMSKKPAGAPLSTFLRDLPSSALLDDLARSCGLMKRRSKKLSPTVILAAFLSAVTAAEHSCLRLCSLASLCSGVYICKQALHKRFGPPVQMFLGAVLARLLADQATRQQPSELLPAGDPVRRILTQDSVTIALHSSLREDFPGSRNQTSRGQAWNLSGHLRAAGG